MRERFSAGLCCGRYRHFGPDRPNVGSGSGGFRHSAGAIAENTLG